VIQTAVTRTENSSNRELRSNAVWSAGDVTDEPLSSDHDAKQVELSDCHSCSCSGQSFTARIIGRVIKVKDFALIF